MVVSPATLASFALTSFLIELTPGPNLTYLAVLSATSGRRAGLAATVGVASGLLLVGLAAALGLATAINDRPRLYALMRWVGVVYLLWLAWEGWRDSANPQTNAVAPPLGDGGYVLRGFLTNVLNPKAAAFYLALLPSFIDASSPPLGQTLMLTLAYVAIATSVHISIVIAADAARARLVDPTSVRVVGRILSLALVGVAIWFAIATAR